MKILERLVAKIRMAEFHSKRIEFYQDWARSIAHGELLVNFLKNEYAISMAKQTSDPSRALALKTMLLRIQQGVVTMPSQVIGMSMPKSDLVMLSAADSASEKGLVLVLNDLCVALEEQAMARKILIKSIVAPILLLPGMGVFAYVLSTQVIPIIEKAAPPEVWTSYNNAVRIVAKVIEMGGAIFCLMALAFAVVVWFSLSRWTAKIRFRMEKVDPALSVWLTPIMPWLLPLSIYRDFQAVLLLSSLAVLLKSGKTLIDALETIAAKSTPYLQHHVRRILNYLHEYPTEVSSAFASGILAPRVSARLATIARTTNKYEDVLIHIGTKGTVEIRNQVESSAGRLNLIFMSLTSALMIFLYLGQLNITRTMKSELDPSKIEQRKMEKEQRMGQ